MDAKKAGDLPVDGILEVDGARCASCMYTIEKLGRKVEGVTDVRVDANAGEIRVRYDGNPEALGRIAGIVQRLGYTARVKASG